MAQPFFAKLPLAYHTMMNSCKAWAHGQYSGMQGKVFDGTAVRPRRDLLLWSAAAEGLDQPDAVTDVAAAAAAVNGNSKPTAPVA
jgi:hypothetical protein